MKAIAIIPARYASSRFPGKPLADIDGKPMIDRVYNQVKKCKEISSVWVATDDERIANVVKKNGGLVCITPSELPNGTQRCYNAYINEIKEKEKDVDIIVNVQGDEPYIASQAIDSIVKAFGNTEDSDKERKDIITLVKKIEDKNSIFDPNVVKVVTNKAGKALYFSRQAIPAVRDIVEKERWIEKHVYLKHIGLYAYRVNVLDKIIALPTSELEEAECLEQLRWLENGYNIYTCLTDYDSMSVDIPEDIEKLKKIRTI